MIGKSSLKRPWLFIFLFYSELLPTVISFYLLRIRANRTANCSIRTPFHDFSVKPKCNGTLQDGRKMVRVSTKHDRKMFAEMPLTTEEEEEEDS